MRLGNAGTDTGSACTSLASRCGGRDGDALGHASAGTACGQRQRVIDAGRDAADRADSHGIRQLVATCYWRAGGGRGGSGTEGGVGQSDVGDGGDRASGRRDDFDRDRTSAACHPRAIGGRHGRRVGIDSGYRRQSGGNTAPEVLCNRSGRETTHGDSAGRVRDDHIAFP